MKYEEQRAGGQLLSNLIDHCVPSGYFQTLCTLSQGERKIIPDSCGTQGMQAVSNQKQPENTLLMRNSSVNTVVEDIVRF